MKPLTPLMEKALAKVGLEWSGFPYKVTLRTLEALEVRRLVQIRLHRWMMPVDGRPRPATQWQVRRTFPAVRALEPWSVGWVPKGWRRGDRLRVEPASQGARGQEWRGAVHWAPELGEVPLCSIEADDVACVAFYYAEAPKVDAWLNWWRA